VIRVNLKHIKLVFDFNIIIHVSLGRSKILKTIEKINQRRVEYCNIIKRNQCNFRCLARSFYEQLIYIVFTIPPSTKANSLYEHYILFSYMHINLTLWNWFPHRLCLLSRVFMSLCAHTISILLQLMNVWVQALAFMPVFNLKKK